MAPVELYLIRHGVAAERGPEYPDDTKRPLTDKGRAALRRSAKALNELGVGFDLMISSPLVRTRQTAEILCKHLREKVALSFSDALAPDGNSDAVLQELTTHPRKTRIALVGHEPNVGQLAAVLVGARSPIPFKKGAICRIDVDDVPPKRSGQLIWFLTPRILRHIDQA